MEYNLEDINLDKINYYLKLRRFAEILIISVFMPFFTLLFVISAALTYQAGIKNIIFKQRRFTKDKKIVNIYKIRTMLEDGNINTSPKISSFLRKHRLDEIPQILNILKGDFSLIGPRAEPLEYYQKIIKAIPEYDLRYKVTPGLTGYQQIYQGHTLTVEECKKKLELDLFYIKNISPKMDFKIILRTFYVIFSGFGAK